MVNDSATVMLNRAVMSMGLSFSQKGLDLVAQGTDTPMAEENAHP
jgi:hypothetical protein